MTIRELDVRRTVGDLMRGRYRGYLAAAGALALVLALFGASRIGVDAPVGASTDAAAPAAADELPAEPASAADAATTTVAPLADLPVIDTADRATRVPRPAALRGLYLNAWAAGSSRKLARLIDIANTTEINAFVIDVKEVGEISYRTAVPLAHAIGAGRPYVRNMRAVLDQLKANGIYPIARIVAFRDPVLAEARPELAVQNVDGSGVWQDTHGHKWVDSFNRDVWDYNIAIAREAVALGFSEVQWDYVRFPDVPLAHMRTAEWPARNGRTKEDAIREFMLYSRAQLADLDVPVTADVFGLTVSAHDDMGIGQLWEKMVDATDALLPMVYPSHFARGSYGIGEPNAEPYETVRTALTHARRRTDNVDGAARVIAWLQDFTLGPPRYGPWHVRAQIRAVYDAGYEEWVLWHPGSNYSTAALASADGVVPDIPEPAPVPLPAPAPKSEDSKRDAHGILGTPVKTGN